MPWKGATDPYRIWLSEIILQQTRVGQGWAYYERFLARFPTLAELAAAPDDEVMKLWEGLGYYARARNLLHTAREIMNRHGGQFPDTYEGLLALKGIGPYTAAAIASFAFQQPHAVVDGNVFRVLARYFDIDILPDSQQGKKLFRQLADLLIDPGQPAAFNQAIMDFGATVCTPAQPACMFCPMREDCQAWLTGQVDQLPRRSVKPEKKIRYFHYFHLRENGRTWIQKRVARDIWKGLYELPLLETGPNPAEHARWGDLTAQASAGQVFRQALTHQVIVIQFWEAGVPDPFPTEWADSFPVAEAELFRYAFPRPIARYLSQN